MIIMIRTLQNRTCKEGGRLRAGYRRQGSSGYSTSESANIYKHIDEYVYIHIDKLIDRDTEMNEMN